MSQFTARIDLQAIRDNFLTVSALAGDREVLACVKGNAYGHGLVPVARCLASAGARWLTVASSTEAAELVEAGIRCRVLLFPTIAGRDVTVLARAGVSIGVQSSEEARAVAQAAGGQVSLFLKVDAGFGRVGVPLGAAVDTARVMGELPGVTLDGVFTHLPFGASESLPWVRERLKAFGEVADTIRLLCARPLLIQALASTGMACGLDSPGTNAVAPGSLLYGVQPAWTGAGGPRIPGLRPALIEVISVLGSLRDIPAATRFGAGGLRTAEHAMRAGVLPIGFFNSLLVRTPGQSVAVAGQRAPVLHVSLEHAVVDVTRIRETAEGSVVHVLARDAAVGPTLDEVAAAQGRATVEVLVALTGRANYEYVTPAPNSPSPASPR